MNHPVRHPDGAESLLSFHVHSWVSRGTATHDVTGHLDKVMGSVGVPRALPPCLPPRRIPTPSFLVKAFSVNAPRVKASDDVLGGGPDVAVTHGLAVAPSRPGSCRGLGRVGSGSLVMGAFSVWGKVSC